MRQNHFQTPSADVKDRFRDAMPIVVVMDNDDKILIPKPGSLGDIPKTPGIGDKLFVVIVVKQLDPNDWHGIRESVRDISGGGGHPWGRGRVVN